MTRKALTDHKRQPHLININVSSRFISHLKTESWGSSILIMEKNGKAFGRLYWYSDDNSTIYLDMLSVDIERRKQGIGTELQQLREEIGRNLGATSCYLWVQKNTWMHNWYKRRGYEDWQVYVQEENSIWMRKLLV